MDFFGLSNYCSGLIPKYSFIKSAYVQCMDQTIDQM